MNLRRLAGALARNPEIGLGVALGLGALFGSGALGLPSLGLLRRPAPAPPPPAAPASQATAARAIPGSAGGGY